MSGWEVEVGGPTGGCEGLREVGVVLGLGGGGHFCGVKPAANKAISGPLIPTTSSICRKHTHVHTHTITWLQAESSSAVKLRAKRDACSSTCYTGSWMKM